MTKRTLVFAVICFALVACGGRKVEVADPDLDLHLSGNWNDADSHDVAASIIPQCLSDKWIERFQTKYNRPPVIRAGHIRVRVEDLDDEIDTDIFVNDLTRAFVGSGRVRVVASRVEAQSREGARDFRKEMAEHAKDAPADRQETAADFLLTGGILTQNDDVLDKGLVSGTYKRVKFYQVTLTLTDLSSNELTWSGKCERKKLIEQPTTSWGLGP